MKGLAVGIVAALAGVLVYFYGFWRTLIALVMFVAIVAVGGRHLGRVVTLPPDDDHGDVSSYNLKYVCTMCGLELKLEAAAQAKAPTHCREPMVLVREGGKPPLRPVE